MASRWVRSASLTLNDITSITAKPVNPTNSTSATFAFSSEAGATFQCQLDNASYTTCTSPLNFTALSAGNHTFNIKATDVVENTETPQSYTWYIDLTPPAATISAKPATLTNTTTASFAFSSEPGATFQCHIDSGSYAACNGTADYTGLADGNHTFYLKSTDTVGNSGESTYSWTVDATGPSLNSLTINSGVTVTSNPGVTLALSATDTNGVAKMMIANNTDLSGGVEEAYATSKSWTLPSGDGTKTIYVKFKDTLGNWSQVYSSTITLDTTPPVTTITAKPLASDSSRTATFSFSSEAGATFQCSLDSDIWSGCSSPQSFNGLLPGNHTFKVKGTDSNGNSENPPQIWTWGITAKLSVSKNGTGTGTVTPDSGTISGGVMSVIYGNPVVLTATPDPGWSFTGWSGACSGTGTCTVAMNSDNAVTATFNDNIPPTVSVTRSDGALLIERAVRSAYPDADAQQVAKEFFVSPATVCYRGVEFNPKGTSDNYLNLWEGPTIVPRKGLWLLIQDFLFVIICDSDWDCFLYLIHFIAHALQKPEEKPGVTVVMIGGQGVGKGTVGRVFQRIWSATYIQVNNVAEVVGTFNAILERAYIVFLDEALFAGNRRGTDELKSIVTEPIIQISEKYQPSRQIRSVHRFIAATNSDHFKNTERDDRRDFTLRVSEVRKGDLEYWRTLNDEIENGGVEAMVFDLWQIDLTGFNVRNKPNTKELVEQKIHSLDPIQRWWHDGLYNGTVANRDDWPRFISTQEAIDGIIEVNGGRMHKKPSAITIAQALQKLCPSAKQHQHQERYDRHRGYLLPSLQQARAEFEKYIGGVVQWPEDDITEIDCTEVDCTALQPSVMETPAIGSPEVPEAHAPHGGKLGQSAADF